MKTAVKYCRVCLSACRASAFVAVAVTLTFMLPAHAVSFRPVPALPKMPPSVTVPAERQVLKEDRDRLRERRAALLERRAEYRRDCPDRLTTGSSRRRHCAFRLQEMHRQSARLRRDIGALRTRFRTIEENVMRRRHGAALPLPRRDPGAGGTARLAVISEFLATAGDDWKAVLELASKKAGQAAGNPVLRDAAAYLEGMHRGEIAADSFEDPHYKHGVRRWLAGDYWSAALSFARAARDNPDDTRVFVSFAKVAGRQHASPACVRAGRCVTGRIADWVSRFGKSHGRQITEVLRRVRRGGRTPAFVDSHRRLSAIAVFAAKSDTHYHPDPAIQIMAADALTALRRGDGGTAMQRYVKVWERLSPRRAKLFLRGYDEGLGRPDALNGGQTVGGQAADSAYLVRMREVLAARSEANPFSGALTQAQIIRLQR